MNQQPSQRVLDILAKMTVEEKAAQLSCVMPSMVLEKGVFDQEKAEKEMPEGVGRMTQFAAGFTEGAKQAAEGYNAIQKYIIEKTGLPANGVNLKKTGWHFLSIRNLTTVDLKNLWRIEIYY